MWPKVVKRIRAMCLLLSAIGMLSGLILSGFSETRHFASTRLPRFTMGRPSTARLRGLTVSYEKLLLSIDNFYRAGNGTLGFRGTTPEDFQTGDAGSGVVPKVTSSPVSVMSAGDTSADGILGQASFGSNCPNADFGDTNVNPTGLNS